MSVIKGTPEEAIAKLDFEVTSFREISDEELPSSRKFRNAWKDTGKTVKLNLTKARGIIRDKRNKKLEELDGRAWNESRKPVGNIAEVESLAQSLRDLPERPEFSSNRESILESLVDEIEGI